MKKKLTLLCLILSSLLSLPLQAAQASINPFTQQQGFPLFYHISNDMFSTSLTLEGPRTPLLNIKTKPAGTELTFDTLMKAAHGFAHSFCFILCTAKDSPPAVVLTNGSLEPLEPTPPGMTSWRKLVLYPGGKGYYFSPEHIIRPVVVLKEVPAPYPVIVEKIVTIPYRVTSSTVPLLPASQPKSATLSLPLPSAAASSQEMIIEEERKQREAELSAKANAQHEQEKIRAAEATKKIQEAAALRALKDKEKEEIKRNIEEAQKEKDRRAQQAERDKKESARQKAATTTAQETPKKTAQETPKKKELTASTISAAPKEKKKDKKNKNSKDDSDDILEKAMARAAAERTALADKQRQELEKAKAAEGSSVPDKDKGVKLQPLSIAERARPTETLSQATPRESAMKNTQEEILTSIAEALANGELVKAKKLLENVNPHTSAYFSFLMDIFLNQPSLVPAQEVEYLMTNAQKLARDRKITEWGRCLFYFGLAHHETDPSKQEEFLDECLALDKKREHFRARALQIKLKLARYDSMHPVCKAGEGLCLHTQAFCYSQSLERERIIFGETVFLTIKLLVKMIQSPETCEHLKNYLLGRLKIDPKRALIDYYDRMVRKSDPTETELAKINSMIPPDVLPPHELHHLE